MMDDHTRDDMRTAAEYFARITHMTEKEVTDFFVLMWELDQDGVRFDEIVSRLLRRPGPPHRIEIAKPDLPAIDSAWAATWMPEGAVNPEHVTEQALPEGRIELGRVEDDDLPAELKGFRDGGLGN